MMRLGRVIFAAAFLVSASSHAVLVSSVGQGRWDDTTTSVMGNTFTGTDGGIVYRSYFLFDLSGVAAAVSGTLDLELLVYVGDGSETLEVYDVTSSIADLTGMAGAPGVFDDLGNGALYGTTTTTAADVFTSLSFVLSAAAIADINASSGGLFALGVSLVAPDINDTDGVLFGFDPTKHRLNLVQAVPEPGTLSLLAAGLLGLGLMRRKQVA